MVWWNYEQSIFLGLVFYNWFYYGYIFWDIAMTNQEIKDRAPHGATHYDRDCDYLRLKNSKWSVWNSFHEVWQPMNTPTEEAIARFKIKPL